IPYVRLPKSPKRLQTLEFQPGGQFARRHYVSPPRAPLSFSANADTGEGRVWTGRAAGGTGEGGGPGGRDGALTATGGAGCGAAAAAACGAAVTASCRNLPFFNTDRSRDETYAVQHPS